MSKKLTRWARHFDACRLCNTSARAHSHDGMCISCASRTKYRRRNKIPEDQPLWSRGHREDLPEVGALLKELGHEHPKGFRDLLEPETRAKMEALEMKDGQWIIGNAKDHAKRLARIYGSPSKAHDLLTSNGWDTERRIEKADREFRKAVMFCLRHEGAAV